MTSDIQIDSSNKSRRGSVKYLKFDLVGDNWLPTISDSSSSNINTLLKDTLKDEKIWIAIELDGYYKVCKIDERDEKVPTFKSIATIGFKTQNREVNPNKCLGVSRSSSNKRMVMSICGIDL
ncbi:hypothetical protein DICPUDRAFT_74796 [Dictyostelium purpureum]|uniref:Uncharacterized protein n=1 Tax=Dictyostelium purpureum TaxID=5786 RepID=F0Z8S0_DICPU|nr:uncharacterized protein DICPUDRAFT_74796 [Dictyostelium purpureum]EGC39707.1 hypothetical protein DICPUDRAFT_74796 [Dictyostelium purpureum]|eukprot:XP_003283816.1 hypothetical protein DICPUDRAFT_74796 [Dictyostelium purpureum]